MRVIQVLTLIVTAASSSHQKFNLYRKSKCCSETLSQSYQRLQPWTDSLKAATYQSIIRHLDFPGSLDGRLDRDEKLWSYLQEAKFVTDPRTSFDDLFEETATGILIENPQPNQRSTFEFKQTAEFDFECPSNNCYSLNNSLLALWRVRKSNSPNSMWIRVKLPKIRNNPVEDMYYYSAKYGLKKLSPDPTELNYFKRHHRFSASEKKKNDFKYSDRMDFHFPNFKNIYGTGRVTPSSFMYDLPLYPESEEDYWYGLSKKPFNEDDFESSGRHHHLPTSFYSPSRPHVLSRPQEYDHYAHIHPSISPSQELDRPPQEGRGFMPSVGPISAPPPYRTEYAYDPRYLMYYTNQQNAPQQHTTVPPKYFKPSTEYVRYSEIDPFFHPDNEAGIEQTSPMPVDNAKPIKQFSSTINDHLPTNLFADNPKPFQIIVGNMNSQSNTLSKPTITETFPPEKKQPVPERKLPSTSTMFMSLKPPTTDRPEIEEEISVIAFGEKIKPKTTTTTRPKTLTTKPTFKIKPAVTVDYKTQMNEEDDTHAHIMTTEELQNNPLGTVSSKLTNEANENSNLGTEFIINSTQSVNNKSTTEEFTEPTNADDIDKSSFYFNSKTTENFLDANKMLNFSLKAAVSTDEPDIPSGRLVEEVNTTPNTEMTSDEEDTIPKTEVITQTVVSSATTEDRTEKTTVIDMETTTDTINNTDEIDFFSSLTNFFSATTEMTTDEATTEISTKQPPIADPDTQESRRQNTNYRLLTFPGDPVSIVANRISKTVSYQTATGKEMKLHSKQLLQNRHRFSSMYKDYSKIL